MDPKAVNLTELLNQADSARPGPVKVPPSKAWPWSQMGSTARRPMVSIAADVTDLWKERQSVYPEHSRETLDLAMRLRLIQAAAWIYGYAIDQGLKYKDGSPEFRLVQAAAFLMLGSHRQAAPFIEDAVGAMGSIATKQGFELGPARRLWAREPLRPDRRMMTQEHLRIAGSPQSDDDDKMLQILDQMQELHYLHPAIFGMNDYDRVTAMAAGGAFIVVVMLMGPSPLQLMRAGPDDLRGVATEQFEVAGIGAADRLSLIRLTKRLIHEPGPFAELARSIGDLVPAMDRMRAIWIEKRPNSLHLRDVELGCYAEWESLLRTINESMDEERIPGDICAWEADNQRLLAKLECLETIILAYERKLGTANAEQHFEACGGLPDVTTDPDLHALCIASLGARLAWDKRWDGHTDLTAAELADRDERQRRLDRAENAISELHSRGGEAILDSSDNRGASPDSFGLQ